MIGIEIQMKALSTFNLNINDVMAILHFKNGVFIPMLTEVLNILKSNLLHILKLLKGILFICGDLEVTLELISLSQLIITLLLRYNSLPCGTHCCSRMATRYHGQRLRKIDIYSWP